MTEFAGNQPQPPDPAQPIAPPPYTPTIYPPAKKGPSALKIVLIVVAVFVGLGLIGIGVVSYGVYKVFKASHMTTSSQPVTEADLGVPIYPGAEQGKGTMRMTIAGKNMLKANFLTTDATDQVIAFYKSSLGSDVQSTTSARGETFVLKKGEGEQVIVTISQSAGLEEGKTQIVIVHATKAAASSN
jgi:hypothetical protein